MKWAFDAIGKLARGGKSSRAEVVPMPDGMFRANVWTRKGYSSCTFPRAEHAQEWADYTLQEEQ